MLALSLYIGDLDVQSSAKTRQQQREEITGLIKRELQRNNMIKVDATGVPWKKMYALCWEHQVFWEGVPLEFNWNRVPSLCKVEVGHYSLNHHKAQHTH